MIVLGAGIRMRLKATMGQAILSLEPVRELTLRERHESHYHIQRSTCIVARVNER